MKKVQKVAKRGWSYEKFSKAVLRRLSNPSKVSKKKLRAAYEGLASVRGATEQLSA